MAWGARLLAGIRAEGDAGRPPLPEQDPQSDVPVSEDFAVSGQVGATAAESAVDSPGVGGWWSWGDAAGTGPDDAGLFAFDADFDLDGADFGVGAVDSAGESSGRKQGLGDGSGEGTGRRSSVLPGLPELPEVGGSSAAFGGLSGVEPSPWDVDEAGGGDVADLVAGEGYVDRHGVEFFGFGLDVGVVDRGTSAVGSADGGAAELLAEFGGEAAEPGGVAVDPAPGAVEAAEQIERAESLHEAARVEARRARDAGEPYSGAALGKKFGKSKAWGKSRLAEIKTEDGGAGRPRASG